MTLVGILRVRIFLVFERKVYQKTGQFLVGGIQLMYRAPESLFYRFVSRLQGEEQFLMQQRHLQQ